LKNIKIIDIGVSNVKSVENMIRRIGFATEVQNEPKELNRNDFYILPGVGAFDEGIRNLEAKEWREFLIEAAKKEISILGLCLGMQLLCDGSEEGSLSGIGIVPGRIKKFSEKLPTGNSRKVPHMGWNNVEFKKNTNDWLKLGTENPRYYFVHSYYYSDIDSDSAIGYSNYEEPFVSAIKHGSVIGLQFHPEKSHKFGMELLKTLIEL
jgi:imidazole glycerol-phosphate synthase subunit HisH